MISWRHETLPRRSSPAYGRICLRLRKSAFLATFSIWAAIRFWRTGSSASRKYLPGFIADPDALRSNHYRGAGSANRQGKRDAVKRAAARDCARRQAMVSRPVSIMQENVFRIERELPGLPQFNLPFAYRLQGPLNVSGA